MKKSKGKALKESDADLQRKSRVKPAEVDRAAGKWKTRVAPRWRGLIDAK
jgi:hypothetical protein